MSKYNNELHKHKAADTIKWIVAFVLIIAIMGAVVCLALQVSGVFDFFKKDDAPAEEQVEALPREDEMNFEIQNSELDKAPVDGIRGVSLAIATTAAAAPNTVEKQLKLTVNCENAEVDTSATWTIEWVTNPGNNVAISDYLTIAVDNGERSTDKTVYTCTVTAKKAFVGGVALIKAVTKVGGFEATCSVTYDGKPEELTWSFGGKSGKNIFEEKLMCSQTHTVVGGYTNTLGVVGASYKPNFIVKEAALEGKIVMTKCNVINGSRTPTSETIIVPLSSGYDTWTDNDTYLFGQMCSVSFDGFNIKVNIKKSFSAFTLPLVSQVRTGTLYVYKQPYQDPRGGGAYDKLYIKFKAVDQNTNLELYFRFEVDTTVTSALFDLPTMAF